MNTKRTLLVLVVFFGIFHALTGQKTSIFQYLTQTEGNALHLEFDITQLIANKKTNEYLPGALTLADGSSMSVKVRARGKFRRRISEVPPLKIKFAKKELNALGLDTLNEVKIVLPVTFEPEAEARLLLEYAAYRMYEQISDFHFKARLIRLTLRDRHVEQSRPEVWAILLEHEEELAVRYQGTVDEQFGITTDSLQANSAAVHAAFQYMIGNTDWSIEDQRNVCILRLRAAEKGIVIPYDFDFSGLVSAPYSSPASGLGLTTVREHALLKGNLTDKEVRKGIDVLLKKEAGCYETLNRARLSAAQIQAARQYLSDFFDTLTASDTIPDRIPDKARSLR